VNDPTNPPTHDWSGQVAKFLSHQKVSWVELLFSLAQPWWANSCEAGWLTLTLLIKTIPKSMVWKVH